MSVTGLFLILFLTFHAAMNAVAIFSYCAYDKICEFLGANWYALVGTAIIAAGALIHILYAFLLSWQNKRARGNDSYAVTSRPKDVEWASKNMLALGIVICFFICVHLMHFWAKMQLPEMMGDEPDAGSALLVATFHGTCGYINLAIYVIGIVALCFHMTHGFWSAFQSLGANNKLWQSRLRLISKIWAGVVCGLFLLEAVCFTVKSNCACCADTACIEQCEAAPADCGK